MNGEKCIICERSEVCQKFFKGKFAMMQCKNCGLMFIEPVLSEEEQKKVYSQQYVKNRTLKGFCNHGDLVGDFRRKTAQLQITKIEGYGPAGKILDVGCGEGYFLDVCRKRGWKVNGVEISEFAAQETEEKIGKRVFTGSLREAGFEENYFDVITFFDVIEHFSDPVRELAEALRILKKGGLICIQTPNAGGIAAGIMGQRWFQIKPREHLFYFSKKSLRKLLEKLNFNVSCVKSVGAVLTIEYVASVLGSTNPHMANLLKLVFYRAPIYKKPLYMKTGHILCMARKRA